MLLRLLRYKGFLRRSFIGTNITIIYFSLLISTLFFISTAYAQVWNRPHSKLQHANAKTKSQPRVVGYSSFVAAPKTLDPAKTYSSDAIRFLAQIVEPPLQYSYLQRPYKLESLVANNVSVQSYDSENNLISNNANKKSASYSWVTVSIKPGIKYAPHPAFAKNANGDFIYYPLTQKILSAKRNIADFKFTATRKLTAADFIYQIKRLADPRLSSPIYPIMQQRIPGLRICHDLISKYEGKYNISENDWIDLRKFKCPGLDVVDSTHYKIKINGVDPQFKYWLAMTFFVPTPWEVDRFYHQPNMDAHHIGFDWNPVGTGPYLMQENDPNRKIVLEKNPNYRADLYPKSGTAQDIKQGFLKHAGQKMPFIDRMVYQLDKESIPRWNKFLQGYLDRSGISGDQFDQAIRLDAQGNAQLTEELQQQAIRFDNSISPSIYYIGFNMLDPIVGGKSESARWLRQALSIAIDYEEYISIFLNGRGRVAQGPFPPDISGNLAGEKGINPVVYRWLSGSAQRKPIAEAKKLLIKAGYPDGINKQTGKPLVLNYDVAGVGSPDEQTRLAWMRKQVQKLGIQLHIHSQHYNRFRERVRTGQVQLFSWGWLADFPDPENFIFLLLGKNGKVKHGGENAANYTNPRFDKLYEQIRITPNGKKRDELLAQALNILRVDSPWIWGFHPIDYTLSHSWADPIKAHGVANNLLKYQNINATQRKQLQYKWNQPHSWPWIIIVALLALFVIPLSFFYWRRQRQPRTKRYEFKD